MRDGDVKRISSLSVIAGARLRSLRLAAGMSQVELAGHMEVKQSVVSSIERGKREVYLRHLDLAAQAFGVPAVWFLAENDRIRAAVDALRDGGPDGGRALIELGLAMLRPS